MDPEVDLGIDEDVAADLIEDLLGDDFDVQAELEPGKKKPEPTKEEPSDEDPESDDDTDPEGDPEDDSSEDPEEGEGDPEEEEPSEVNPEISDETLVDIKIGDDTYEVNFAELRAGYLRQEDYIAKVNTQEAEYLEKSSKVEELEAQLSSELRQAAVMLTGDLSRYEQINWQGLKEADPAKYNELRVEYAEAKERVTAIVERQRGIDAMHKKAQQLRHEAYVRGQVELADKLVPGFREPEFFKNLVKFGESVGYTQSEIENITDARQLLLLNNAKLYAEGVVKKKAALENRRPAKELPPVIKPGATKSDTSVRTQQTKKAAARLKSENSEEAAAAYLMTLDL
jgi:AAA ATPase containing von Willebrand factor type A (vWA) domain